MPWYLTTPRQIKGFRRELNRVDEALSRQDVRGLGSPLARLRGAMGLGAAAGGLVLVAALVTSLISPKPDGSVAAIMTTRNGGMFVQFNGRLHPVTNLASARLIVGKPDPAQVVTDLALRSMPTGQLMGIPSAPDLLDPRTDRKATWTVCDWRDTAVPLSLLRAGDITTAVIAGDDMLDGGEDLGRTRAELVRPTSDPSQLWLVYRDTRAQVGRDDFAAQAALGLTPAAIDAAVNVSPSLLGTIQPSPALTAPRLADQGQPSPTVNGSAVGDVLTVATASGSRSFYLVGKTGVQLVGPVLAQMMINTGSAQKLVEDPATVQNLPRVSIVDDSRFPSAVPTLTSDPALCWSWSKTVGELSAHTRVFTSSRMPVNEAGRIAAVTLLPNDGSVDQATQSVTRPGAGWYVRTTGNNADSVASEQLLWIDPNGTRYPIDAVLPESGGSAAISYDPTVKALGLNSIAPLPIPWAVARLYAPGATLSIKNAQVLQPGMIKPASQVPSPATRVGSPPPPPAPAATPADAAPPSQSPAADGEPANGAASTTTTASPTTSTDPAAGN
ncbi:type VII secretion protein EccB [Mycolicibacterium aubagnense]|uniref:Type VII secretion protein EccB n=1 Tax=Mycolicibacterium aubagnense TaxID=319707 RepID=A0ABM7I6N3_9MYCO|nr:type VII secretion protein EccB [Mycolicibacterium aubagnense]BBX82210.1 type VII secretion protein EccB [Mycolicibacterium aubagnense]